MNVLDQDQMRRVSGAGLGMVGDAHRDHNGNIIYDLSRAYPCLYVAVGGRWVPIGTEPFMGPVGVPGIGDR